ncbi:MAG: TIGR03087 family PEP-CTERM/XrtA system glycosyltransferase [Planctomycetota bacterium]
MNSKRNILYLAHRLPYPPNKGDRIRTYHQIKYLAERHRVWCACFSDELEDARHITKLREMCENVAVVPWNRGRAMIRSAMGLLRGMGLTLAAYHDARMHRIVSEWSNRVSFDATIAFSACMGPYALEARTARRLLDLCDVDSQKWVEYAEMRRGPASWLCQREARHLRAFEEASLGRFDAVTVITNRERNQLDLAGSSQRLHVVGNGVTPPTYAARAASTLGSRIGFVGAMDYPPNVEAVKWFVSNVWHRIREKLPLAQFVIIGRNPTNVVRRLVRTPGVEISGTVADVSALIRECRVIVAPLRIARGLQNKVLEAMALGRPVVATTSTAYSLDAEAGRDIVVADQSVDFAAKTLQLLTDDALCDEVAEAGRTCVEQHHSWRRILREYERILLGAPTESNVLVSGSTIQRAPPPRRPLGPLVSGLASRGAGRFVS